MATHSSILAWEIPWAEELCELQQMGWQRVGHDLATRQSGEFKKKSKGGGKDKAGDTSDRAFVRKAKVFLSLILITIGRQGMTRSDLHF